MTNINRTLNLVENGMKISQALKEVYKTRKVQIPFDDKDFDVSIQMLELNTRTSNALMRAKLTTLEDIIDHMNKYGWHSVRNFGQVCAAEIFECILDVAWDFMNTEEKAEFMLRVDEQNEVR